MDDPFFTETQTVELTASEVVSLLSSLSLCHARETEYSPEGFLVDHNLIGKLTSILRGYSTSGTGDGVAR